MARILSIDWDYFVEEDPMLDMGHRESVLFLTTMWEVRQQLPGTSGFGDLVRALPFRGPEPEEFFADYLGHIKADGHMQYVCTAESHSALPKWANEHWPNEQLDIINVDAHHDILYGLLDPAQANDQAGFNCGNWAGHLMAGGRVRSYTQVYPAWRKKFPEGIPDELRLWVRKCGVKLKLQDAPWTSCRRRIDGVFLARSGCWVPPVYDAKFDTLCKFFGGGLVMSREEVCRMQREWELDALEPQYIVDLIRSELEIILDLDNKWERATKSEQAQRALLTAASDQWAAIAERLKKTL